MGDRPSKYVSKPLSETERDLPRSHSTSVRPPRTLSRKLGYARVDQEEIVKLGQTYGTSLALHLEMIRLSGMHWVKRRDGWIVFDQDMRITLGLSKRQTCSDAVKRLSGLDFLEARGTPGSRLECRLNPNWAKPKAEVVGNPQEGK